MKKVIYAFCFALLSLSLNVALAQSTSNITSTGFTATWSVQAGATAYEIDVYQKQNVAALDITEGFNDGVIPADWDARTDGTYANDYGAAAPSIALKQTGQYIAIPSQEQFITYLQFWCKGQTTNNQSCIVFSIEYAGRWLVLDTIRPLPASGAPWGGPISNMNGITAFKLTYNKSAGNVAIDDVRFITDGVKRTYVSGYKAKNVGNALSCNVSGLTAGATYYFVVRGLAGSDVKPIGAEASATLPLPIDTCTQHPLYSYYGNICDYKQLSGAALKTKLHNKIKGHKARIDRVSDYNNGYYDLWTHFQQTDKLSDGKVWDMYSNCSFTFGSASVPGRQCGGGSYTNACDCYNREHSFPRSWMRPTGQSSLPDTDTAHNDLFHVIPTDGYTNEQRGNDPLGEVGSSPTFTSNNGTKKGTARSGLGYSTTVWEPIDEYKGDFARAYFYMVTRYENRVGMWYSNNPFSRSTLNGTKHPAFTDWTIKMLLEWHKKDPVSPKEIARNNAIYGIQNNRNPFIDFPELAEKVWGTSSNNNNNTAVLSENAEVLKIYPNPVNNTLNVELPTNAVATEYIIYSQGGILQQKGVTLGVIDVSGLAGGTYFIVLSHKKRQHSTRFVKGI